MVPELIDGYLTCRMAIAVRGIAQNKPVLIGGRSVGTIAAKRMAASEMNHLSSRRISRSCRMRWNSPKCTYGDPDLFRLVHAETASLGLSICAVALGQKKVERVVEFVQLTT